MEPCNYIFDLNKIVQIQVGPNLSFETIADGIMTFQQLVNVKLNEGDGPNKIRQHCHGSSVEQVMEQMTYDIDSRTATFDFHH